jgi:hypothetical protein
VVIAIEVLSPKGFGRVRMERVDDVSGASVVPFVVSIRQSTRLTGAGASG